MTSNQSSANNLPYIQYRKSNRSTAYEIRALLDDIAAYQGPPLTFMEVCGTHTMAIAKSGLRSLLPSQINLVSGPGCPVCVTPVSYIDHALALSHLSSVTLTTFGDLLRVPGSPDSDEITNNLIHAKARGADIRVVYSPLEALKVAREHPSREIVFLGVGFETTTPIIAATILNAQREGLNNFSVLCAHKTIPEAMAMLANSDELKLDGFLAPGHVSVVLGHSAYTELAIRYNVPCVIAGFEAIEIVRALSCLVAQCQSGRAVVENCYSAVVHINGNPRARHILSQVFEPCDSIWRGLGIIAHSGLRLRSEYAKFDAALKFSVSLKKSIEPVGCHCGEVLRGILDPVLCPLFGKTCTPENPIGACMVSSEGSCAARYYEV
ncbi:MAG: hydrogenase formation protein HypD [Deltaproteobacteria bacterium]|nr:hydrogenase formation protein HypD [Deltaproteobacteria bacterium]